MVAVDRVTGTPRVVARFGSSLTRPSDADAAEIALDYVAAHRGVFGLDAGQIDALEQADRYTTLSGVTYVYWRQAYRGIELSDEGLAAAVADDGRLLTVTGPPRPDPSVPSTKPELGVAQAMAIAAADARVEAPKVEKGPSGDDRATTFADESSAGLSIYGLSSGTRLAWRVELDADSQHYYAYEIDARSGEILSRHNLVLSENARVHELWPHAEAFSPAFNGGSATNQALKRLNGNDPWRYDTTFPPYNLPFQTLGGNQAFLLLDFNDDDGASATPQFFVQPSDGGPNWIFPQVYNNGFGLRCPPANRCTWSNAGPFQNWFDNASQGGTQIYWFTNEFHDHLLTPAIGFTEASGNFELVNQDGQGGQGNDDVFLEGFDGANTGFGYPDDNHLNNANMLTRPDGQSPTMQMYLFSQFVQGQIGLGDPAFEVFGGDDATVIMHEYTHGLSNRLVGGPAADTALNAQQSGAMGEAWSDWYAHDYLVAAGRLPDKPGVSGELLQGRYEGFTSLIRSQPLDCAVGAPASVCRAKQGGTAGSGGYTYGDYGKILGEPEVHADGEIWGQTLWDLRTALIAKRGSAAGISHAEQLITDGMRMAPLKPSFLDARDGILQANAAGNLGDQAVIWKTFAARGMGAHASTNGPNDNHPTENFRDPLAKGGGPACQSATKKLKKAKKQVRKAKKKVRKAKGKKAKKRAKKKLKKKKKKLKKAKAAKKLNC